MQTFHSRVQEDALVKMQKHIIDVCESASSYIKSTSPYKNIEFEVRFGHIRNHQGKQYFDSSVSKKTFDKLKGTFDNSNVWKCVQSTDVAEYFVNECRYTVSNNTGQFIECIHKSNIIQNTMHLDENKTFDIRMAYSHETPVQVDPRQLKPLLESAKFMRSKKRWSYTHEMIRFDLSEVCTADKPNPIYEIEIEIVDMPSALQIYQYSHIAKTLSYKVCDVLYIISETQIE